MTDILAVIGEEMLRFLLVEFLDLDVFALLSACSAFNDVRPELIHYIVATTG